MVEDTAANEERCMCPGCPTYNDLMRAASEALFCARGETTANPEAKSCLCGGCTVWAANSLTDYFYCIKGAAK